MTDPSSPLLPSSQQPEGDNDPFVDVPPASRRTIRFPWWEAFLGAMLVLVLLLSALTIFVLNRQANSADQTMIVVVAEPTAPPVGAHATQTPKPTSTPLAPTALPSATARAIPEAALAEPLVSAPITIGLSVQGRPLIVYHLGHGPRKRALIGAIHGGYEWNTADLMTKTLDYLSRQPDLIPPDLTLYILPLANPDGYAAGHDALTGRVNGNQVDLNRNWDYHWGPTATHGTRPVSAGTAPFSEPETVALRDFIINDKIEAVIFYHSAQAKVFQGAGITESRTVELAQSVAAATGYKYAPEGVPGQITTGDAIDWLTVNGITAIEVELTTHQTLDWEQNLAGLQAFLNWNLPETAPPVAASSPPPPGATRTIYTVQAGDTLWTIAEHYGVSVDAIAQANNLADINNITVGQPLIIPGP